MEHEWITPYSSYYLSRYSTEPKKVVECENKDCKKKFITNIDRKRCSKECAKKARKQNKNISTENES